MTLMNIDMPNRIAILIPCYNEGLTLTQVIQDFKHQVPHALIYVYDNGSTDDSVALALAAGAIVKHVPLRGKGQVVRRMFADIDADIYVMVDGDATYDASYAQQAINQLYTQELDMVVCTRIPCEEESFRVGHAAGNKVFTHTVNFLFGHQFEDIFSGYRIFSRRFVKSFPAFSQGFEIEAEMTIHALQLAMPTAEIATPYQKRPLNSKSKLHTIRDGLRILRTILLLFIYIRPMPLFGVIFVGLGFCTMLLALKLSIHFMQSGLVPHFYIVLLTTALGLLASLSLACGLILDSIGRSRLEIKRCWYLMAHAK